ncbi:MAG: peptidylprolyl isomerase [Longimicrobiales bacterium]
MRLIIVAIGACAVLSGATAQSAPRVVLRTELGEIEIEIDSAHAPVTAANFLRYVDGGFYQGGRFHRTVRDDNQPNDSIRIAVVQASINSARSREQFPRLALERTSVTGLRHRDGTISMARGGPDTATSSFFICIGDQPSLDFGGRRNPDGQGFAAFGRVVRGMDVVRKIQSGTANGQTLTTPVVILEAVRE